MKSRKLLSVLGAVAAAALVLTGCAGSSGDKGDAGGATNDLNLITPGELRVGMDTVSKPFAYADGDNFTGFDIDLMRAMAENLELDVDFVGMDFANLLPSVANGQIDLAASAVSITDERKKTVDFSDGYFIALYTFLTLDDSDIKGESDLAGKKIGVVQGTFQDNYATKNFPDAEVVRFTDHNLTFAALKNGTVDTQFFDLAIAIDYIAENPELGLQTPFNISAEDSPHGFPVKQGNTELAEALNGALASVIADGTYQTLYEQYFPGQPLDEQFQP